MDIARIKERNRKRDAVLELFLGRKYIHVADVKLVLGLTGKQASKLLYRMKEAGLLTCVGRTDTARWYLAGQAADIEADLKTEMLRMRQRRDARRAVADRDDCVHLIVPANSKPAPRVVSPRWVFDLGLTA